MRAARHGEPAPPELELAWMCGEHHLPDAGGLYDQDYVTIHRMRVLDSVYRTVTRMQNLTGHEIHRLTRNERRTIRWLRDEGLWDA